MPSRPRDRRRGALVVARQHDHADAVGAQLLQRLRCRLLHRIADGQKTLGPTVNGEQHDGGAFAAQRIGLGLGGGDVDAFLLQERRIAQQQALAVDAADHALAGRRIEVGDRGEFDLALARGRQDRGGDGMLAAALEAGGKPQHLGFGAARPAARPR